MLHLFELEIFYVAGFDDPLHDDSIAAVFSLTQLKSLVLEPHTGHGPAFRSRLTIPIPAMEQLTRLVLPMQLCGSSLRHLTKMIDLQIVGFENTTLYFPTDPTSMCRLTSLGFLNDLTSMRNLTSLRIYQSYNTVEFPSSVLLQLKKLKRLTLWKMDMDSSLTAMVKLPDLTELGVLRQCCLTNRHGYFSDQTPFSNLRTLVVECESGWPVKEFPIQIPGRCMPNVQKSKFVLEENLCNKPWKSVMKALENSLEWPELIHMFPCLRHVCFVRADRDGRPFEEYRMFSGI